MKENDELLNVDGLIQQKIKQNLSDTIELAEKMKVSGEEINSFSTETDKVMEEVLALSKELGIDTASLEKDFSIDDTQKKADPTLKVTLPKDYNYEKAFDKLAGEAKEAGFQNIEPGELLSAEEMENAAKFADMLDERFEKEIQLTAKDCAILTIAAAVKILSYYIMQYLAAEKTKEAEEKEKASQINSTDTPENVDNSTTVNVQAMKNFVYTGEEIFGKITGSGSLMAAIKNEQSILKDPIPFNVRDNDLFVKSDILGYDPLAGWLFGVVNILSDTVTTKKMESFSVVANDKGELQAKNKLSTAFNVMYPVMSEMKGRINSVVASVVREASVLQVAHTTYDKAAEILAVNMAIEQKNNDLFSYVPSSLIPFEKLNEITKTAAMDSFINVLISAICAVQYDAEKDGDPPRYSIRTNKIIMISNAIAAGVNSIPAFASKDYSKIDFGGAITTCLSILHSTQFWIEAKANYLVSEYKKEIDEQFKLIDKYFVYEQSVSREIAEYS